MLFIIFDFQLSINSTSPAITHWRKGRGSHANHRNQVKIYWFFWFICSKVVSVLARNDELWMGWLTKSPVPSDCNCHNRCLIQFEFCRNCAATKFSFQFYLFWFHCDSVLLAIRQCWFVRLSLWKAAACKLKYRCRKIATHANRNVVKIIILFYAIRLPAYARGTDTHTRDSPNCVWHQYIICAAANNTALFARLFMKRRSIQKLHVINVFLHFRWTYDVWFWSDNSSQKISLVHTPNAVNATEKEAEDKCGRVAKKTKKL